MRDYLVFQLYGPLASWGDIAVGETRPSEFVPAKSAILGLIGAALGLSRPDTLTDEKDRGQCEQKHQALAEGYGMAVKVTLPGLPLTDYHTAQVPSSGSGKNKRIFATRRGELTWIPRHELNTILSRRDYRQDVFAGIALWARTDAPYPLETLADRLLRPKFTLYLGRKSCPTALPLNPVIRSANSVEAVLADCSFAKATSGVFTPRDTDWIASRIDESRPLFCWDGDAETQLATELQITRRDLPISRQRWQFAVREEHRAHAPDGEAA